MPGNNADGVKRELNEHEQSMLQQLRAGGSRLGNGVLKRSACQFILDHGWLYEPGPLRQGIGPGQSNECYNNALNLVLADESLVYVEGFTADECGLRIHHAWVTDGKGRAIDPTWAKPGVVYAGVPFKSSFVCKTGLKDKGLGSLLDDWEQGYPLLQDLGDRPDEWMEPRGIGFAKLT